MKYTMSNRILDLVMKEARDEGIPWYKMVNKMIEEYAAKKANNEREEPAKTEKFTHKNS